MISKDNWSYVMENQLIVCMFVFEVRVRLLPDGLLHPDTDAGAGGCGCADGGRRSVDSNLYLLPVCRGYVYSGGRASPAGVLQPSSRLPLLPPHPHHVHAAHHLRHDQPARRVLGHARGQAHPDGEGCAGHQGSRSHPEEDGG